MVRLAIIGTGRMAGAHADAIEMAEAAKKKGVLTAVNFSKRNVYGTQKAAQMVADGEIGRVMHVECSYFQSWLVSKAWGNWRTDEPWLWRLSAKHGSAGVLGDIGVHVYDMASFIVGDIAELNCDMKTFDKGVEQISEYVLDANDSFVSSVRYANGALDRNFRGPDAEKLIACMGEDIDTDTWKPVECPPIPSTYDRFVESIKTGVQGQTSFEGGARVQAYLEKSFESANARMPVSV